jgi:RND family efflux transporter MFP subunit
MKSINGILIAVLVAGVAAGGYWLGSQRATVPSAATTAKASSASTERKLLYYRNPMGLPDTSPAPKKDAMGMDYVAVYEGEAEQGGQGIVSISTDKVQKLGVKSEAAALRSLDRMLRVTGRIEINERHIYTVAPKFEGWVERLHVNTTGQLVGKGQPLFDVYSPELVSAQREYALAKQGEASLQGADDDAPGFSAKDGMKQLAESGMTRLKNWDITDAQIRQLANGNAKRNLTFHAPVSGIVLEKKAVQGMRFMPGEMLYQIADLSSVWVQAEVAEQDIGQVQPGSTAHVTVDAYPDRAFDGKVDFIYPTMNAATRTVQVRVELANPKGLLKPAMFAQVMLPSGSGGKVLTVPTSAVIDSGARQIVLVQLAQGRFEPRTVTLGVRGNDYVEVLTGIAEGEQVVTSANFLIDAESNLKAALSGLGAHAAHGGNVPGQTTPASKAIGHQAQGVLNAVNADGTVNITHEPIASLKWPGMSMDFPLANSSLATGIQPGSAIAFELVERGEGEWVITKLQAKPAKAHEGH